MAQEFIKIGDLYQSELIPFARSKLTKLIRNGELEKAGELPENTDYIRAINVGMGKQKARWIVSREEIDAYRQRVKNKKSI